MSEDFDLFAELENEIAAATAKKALKSDAAKLKKQALNPRVSKRVRENAAAEFKAVQAIVEANQWEVIRCGALFAEQACDGCGSVHFNFLQYMQEEQPISGNRSRARRWVRVSLPIPGVPIETIIQPLTTHICSDCCEDHGFNIHAPTIKLLPRDSGLTVSAGYTQGDINGAPEETGPSEIA